MNTPLTPAGLFVVTISLLVLIPVNAQRETRQTVGVEKVDLSIVEKIRDEGLKRSHIPDDVQYLTDVIGPRLTGSPAMKRANEWSAEKMCEYGLENVHLEAYEFGRGWEEVSYFGRMTAPFIRPLHGRTLAWTGSTKGLQKGPAVIVTAEMLRDPAKYAEQWKGTWILPGGPGKPRELTVAPPFRLSLEDLFAPPTPAEQTSRSPAETEARTKLKIANFQRRLEVDKMLRENGALGILVRSFFKDGILEATSIMSDTVGSLLKKGGPETLPQIVLPDEDYWLIYRNAARGIPGALEFNIQNRFLEKDLMAYNTIGEIRGTDKREEVVMLGAHLDSWHLGTGATDNAAGSIIVLEAMRILKAIGVKPRRTIRIALWSGEEPESLEGSYLGSSAYVRAHEGEMDKISVGLEVDHGTGRLRGIASELNPYAIPIFEQLFRPVRDLGVVAVQHRRYAGDCRNFDARDVPCFKFIQDPIEYSTETHHSNIDTFDALVMDDLKQAAVVMASTAYHLAMRDEMFPRKRAGGVSETPTAGPDLFKIPEKELAGLTGLYVDPVTGRFISLYIEDGKLFYPAGQSVRRLSPLGKNRFKIVGVDAQVGVEMVFERPIAGGPMQVKVISPAETTTLVRRETPTSP